MKRIILMISIIILWSIAALIQSCEKTCSGGPIKFKLNSIISHPIKITGTEILGEFYPTSFFTYQTHIIDEYIKFDSLGLNIQSDLKIISQNAKTSWTTGLRYPKGRPQNTRGS